MACNHQMLNCIIFKTLRPEPDCFQISRSTNECEGKLGNLHRKRLALERQIRPVKIQKKAVSRLIEAGVVLNDPSNGRLRP